jgi:phage terminase large subunit
MSKKLSLQRSGQLKTLDKRIDIDAFNALIVQIDRERVAPRFDAFRKPARYKVAHGGRGAGAKSWSTFSLAIQFAETPGYFGERCNITVVRKVQNSIKDSSHKLIADTIKRLGYTDWRVTDTYIRNMKNGSTFNFKGLNDLQADNYKSLEDVDILLAEEAAPIGYKAWDTILPSIRKPGSEVWVIYNRDLEIDPCHDLFVLNQRPNSIILELKPGNIDNPWFDAGELPAMRDADYLRDPDNAAHIWEGLPRKQGANSVHSRVAIAEAMKRDIPAEGVDEVGVDVARFGSDSTQMFRRKGLKVVDSKAMHGADTMEVARAVWDFAGQDRRIKIKIDAGYNPGVIDAVRDLGGNVVEINFGGEPVNKDKYANLATEMWFELPVNEASFPDDLDLRRELAGRQFKYQSSGKKIIEQKEEYKKRNGGKSPDKADALILTFYQGKNNAFSEHAREQMRALRSR